VEGLALGAVVNYDVKLRLAERALEGPCASLACLPAACPPARLPASASPAFASQPASQPACQTPEQPILYETGMLPLSLLMPACQSLCSLWRRVAVGPPAHAVPPVGGATDARQPESSGVYAGGLGGAASRQQQVGFSLFLLATPGWFNTASHELS
jgi:hypothetical protein